MQVSRQGTVGGAELKKGFRRAVASAPQKKCEITRDFVELTEYGLDVPDATAATLSGARRAGRFRSHGRRGRLRPPDGTISGTRSLLQQSRQTVRVVQSRAAAVRLLLARRQGRSRKLNSFRRSQVCGFKFASSMPLRACAGAGACAKFRQLGACV